MKVIKPYRLGFLCRPVTSDGRHYRLAVAGLVSVPFDDPRALRMEIALWKDVADHLPGGVLDEAYAKPRAEVLVHGAAMAPGGRAVGAVITRVCVTRGDVTLMNKKLAVIGDRVWLDDKPSEPVPFASMSIDWTHSFGGEGYTQNPLGKGAVELDTEHGKMWPLPNVEDPTNLITSPDDKPLPAGYGVVDLSWPQRMARVGAQYDASWLANRFPGPATDFDAGFYNTAYPDQQFDGFFHGDETIRVEDMHLEGAVAMTLAPLVVKVIVTQACSAEALEAHAESGHAEPLATHFHEHTLSLETVHLLPNIKRAILVYRATVPIVDDEAEDVVHLMLAAEDPQHPKSLDHYAAVLTARLDKERGALLSMRDEDLMPPAAEGWLCQPDYGDMADKMALEHRTLNRSEKARKAQLAEAQAELEAAGFEVASDFKEPEIPVLPDPYDVNAVLQCLDRTETMANELVADMEVEKARLEKEARQSFEAAGFDYNSEHDKTAGQGGGPPDFFAEDHLVTLYDLARIADAGDTPMAELEHDVLDPAYAQMLHELEQRMHASYQDFAHLMPAAALPKAARQQQLRVIVIAAKDSATSLAGRNLTGADLHGLDLSGIDLSEAYLEGADFTDANLHGATLARCVLARANFTRADLSACDLSGANLGDCKLIDTDLSEAVLVDAVLMQSELRGVRLQGARFEGTDFLEVTFAETDFSHTHCRQVLFLQSDMRRVNFAGADLTSARFLQIDLREAVFAGAELAVAQFVQCNGDGAVFAGASMVGVNMVHESSFKDCDFSGADLTKAMLHKCPLTSGDFYGCILNEANLIKAHLADANLRRIVARSALFMRASFRGADLRGADLLHTIAQRADFRGADLRGANFSRGDVSLARFDEHTRFDDMLLLDTRVDPRRQPPQEGQML